MPLKTHQLNTSRGTVEYCDVGRGTPTLYFHGTGAGCEAAVTLEQPLIEDNCRLIVPNRSGYYHTALTEFGTVTTCVDQAAELLDHLAIEKAVVIGTSGGGMPAARFAHKYAERCSRLVLQCSQSHAWDSSKWLPASLKGTLFLFRYRIFRPFLRWETRRQAKITDQSPKLCLRNMSGSRFPELENNTEVIEQITRLTKMTLDCSRQLDGVQNDWAILVGANGIEKGTIKCPTMIIHDREDPLVPFCHAEWSQACIPQATFIDAHLGGHLIWFGKDFQQMHQRRLNFIVDGKI